MTGVTAEIARRKSASHGEAGYARRPHDAYFTEPWVTRALLQAVDFHLPGRVVHATGTMDRDPAWDTIWEPACGDGRMAIPLAQAGYRVIASDIAHWGYGAEGLDFLDPSVWGAPSIPIPNCAAIVTNPPFDLAVQFAQRAIELTRAHHGKVALLQRHEWDAPASHHPLFQAPFAAKLILHKRPKWSDDDKASPRFPHSWYLWDHRHQGMPVLRFLPDPDKAISSRFL